MINSLLSSNRDVAALIPVSSMIAVYLKKCTVSVIDMLESCGYLVFCLIYDNNRINRNMFTDLCGGEFNPHIEHPRCTDRRLFFLFDSVHLLKSIRNNWLGQNDCEHTFVFPNLDSDDKCKASFSHLRQLHKNEKDSIVKMAPCLTHKSLYPSNLERQNIKLVLKVFDEKVVVALDHYGKQNGKDISGTHSFITVILKLWKILNVKSSNKGHRKRDGDSYHIRDINDERLSFLSRVYD